MRFFSDMPAVHGVWDGKKMIEFPGGVYETRKQKEIELLQRLGYRYEADPGEVIEPGKEEDDSMVIVDLAAAATEKEPEPEPEPKPKPKPRRKKR